jgi:hypothetical protein
MEEKKGNERYKILAFAIFGIVLFLSKVRVTSPEVANAFVEYEHIKINPSTVILAETLLSLNHCRKHGQGVMRCCVPLFYL